VNGHRPPAPRALSRRALLQRAGSVGVLWAGAQLTGCSDSTVTQATAASDTGGSAAGATSTSSGNDDRPATTPTAASSASTDGGRSLLVYFSRAGENYFYGDRTNLTVGNTQVVADMIRAAVDVDVYRIEAADPYPDSYDDSVARNVREQDDDARPAIANPLPVVDGYDTVLVGSPIWNVRPPMIMSTFLDSVDLTGKRLAPFVTYAVSGLGNTIDVYRSLASAATLTDGLAVRGEQAGEAGDDIETWLRRLGLLAS
jgi:flavodoxin